MTKKYLVPCTWSMTGQYIIEAESKEDALHKAGYLPLPDQADYLNGSFEAFEYEIEELNDEKASGT